MELEKRAWRVLVGGIDVSELDISFEVHKSLRREPNTCSLTVHNLSRDHRADLEALNIYDPKRSHGAKRTASATAAQKGTRGPKAGRIPVEVHAGYGSRTALIFRGELRRALSSRDGAGWVTTIDGEDGGQSVITARVSRTLPPGTPVLTAVKVCADAMGLGYGNYLSFPAEFARSFSTGSVLDGQASKELAGVLRALGLTFSVQNGVLQFLQGAKGPASAIVQAVLLSPVTGLVGAPQRDATGEVMAQCLMIPDLAPGGYVMLATDTHPGLYSVQTLETSGSTFGNEWYHKLSLLPA